jgi:hypothetical protein
MIQAYLGTYAREKCCDFVCVSGNWMGAAGEDVPRLVGELGKVKWQGETVSWRAIFKKSFWGTSGICSLSWLLRGVLNPLTNCNILS